MRLEAKGGALEYLQRGWRSAAARRVLL